MGDVDAGLGQEVHLVVVQVDGVGQAQVRTQHPQFGQVLDGAAAGVGEIPFRVGLHRAHVGRDAGAIGLGQGVGLAPNGIGVHRMADQRRPGRDQGVVVGREALHLPVKHLDGLIGHGGLIQRGIVGPVARPLADPAADAHLAEAVGDRLEVMDGARLHEAGDAVAQHLQRGHLRRQSLLLLGLVAVERDQPVEHIVVPAGVVGHEASGQGLAGDVDVAVHEARRGDEARAVDGLPADVPGLDVGGLADRHDTVLVDGHRAMGDDPPLGVHGQDGGVADQDVDGRRGPGLAHGQASATAGVRTGQAASTAAVLVKSATFFCSAFSAQ